jgi:hypothetical protein
VPNAGDVLAWESCDCSWVTDVPGGLAPCGCGGEDCVCMVYRDEVIHWLGKHWLLACAFRQALAWAAAGRGEP